MRNSLLPGAALAFAFVVGLAPGGAKAAEPDAVLRTYADIAQATYEDSLVAAMALDATIQRFLAAPSAAGHEAAKAAWRAARALSTVGGLSFRQRPGR